MANALTIFESGALPLHVAIANETANIVPRVSINALTFEGKVWTINLDGKKTKLVKKDDEGDEQPLQIFTGIILDYTKQRGREYYAGAYDPKKPAVPDCWSEDGVKPEADVVHKQSAACASCPMSKKNSVIKDNGQGAVACGQFRKLAVIPANKVGGFPPLRLKIKITSDYDKTGAEANAATGWYAFQQYLDLLVSKNVKCTYALPTKIKFDTTAAFPKLLFSPGKDWLPEEMFREIVQPMALSDEVKELLAQSYSAPADKTGTKALPKDEEEVEVAAAAVPAQAKPKAAKAAPAVVEEDEEDEEEVVAPVKPKAKAAPAVVEEDEEEVQSAEQIAAAKRQAKADEAATATAQTVAKAGKKAAAAKAVVVEDDDEDGEVAVAPAKAPKATAAPAKAAAATPKATPAKGPVNAPADVAGVLDDWDD